MTPRLPSLRRLATSLAVALALVGAGSSAAQAASPRVYEQHNLVSDGAVQAAHTDPNLVNGWGVAFNPTGPVWVSNAGSSTSTLYDGNGKPVSLVVTIPAPGGTQGGHSTGIVFNGSSDFAVSKAGTSAASKFLFATLEGVIAGWSPTVDATHALVAVDNSSKGSIYTGLAVSAGGSGSLLYAADFFHARVDVFDANFKAVATAPGAFTDPAIPQGFAPYGIQAIQGNIYVSYAKQDASKTREVFGKGLGYVDAYGPNGKLLRRVAAGGDLNAPWGMALAPAGFGVFANDLIVGNFGDGMLNAYEPVLGLPLGNLHDAQDHTIHINGLWGIAFGNGYQNQQVNSLFFAAGPDGGAHGLYGRLDVDGNGAGN